MSGASSGGRIALLVVISCLILAGGGVLLWFSRGEPEESAGSRVIVAPALSGPAYYARFVGEQTCRECHPGEAALHAGSGHSRTLHPAGQGALAAWLDGKTIPDPERPGTSWTYHLRDRALSVDRTEGGKTEHYPIDYALGSGKHGATFLSITGAGAGAQQISGLEHRLSFFAKGHTLAVTPGQEGEGAEIDGTRSFPHGRVYAANRLNECLGCHATVAEPQDPVKPGQGVLIPNVSCERCHGPGREHVEAARRGESNLWMPLGSDPPPAYVEVHLCGECHRLPKNISPSSIDPGNTEIVRFQSVGLSLSKCYEQGFGKLRCTSCHDPHARVSRDHAAYEAVCTSCHQSAPQKLCPVSPRERCIECHMPRRAVSPYFDFADHWIRNPNRRINVPRIEPPPPTRPTDTGTGPPR